MVDKVEETKADKFKRLAVSRVNKALEAIAQIKALGNKNNYESTPDQQEKIFNTLSDALEDASKAFAPDAAAPAKAGFSL